MNVYICLPQRCNTFNGTPIQPTKGPNAEFEKDVITYLCPKLSAYLIEAEWRIYASV